MVLIHNGYTCASRSHKLDTRCSENQRLPAGAEGKPRKVSSRDQLDPPAIDTFPRETGDDEYRLQVELRLKREEIAEVEAELLRLATRRQPTRSELCHVACKIYDARRTRDKLINDQLFGEPAWDMLLALFCLPSRGEMLGPSSLGYAANVPPSTSLRWQRILTNEGLIERGPKQLAPRRQFVRLTDQGRLLMERYLARLYFSETPIPPYPEKAGG